jgi:hypothetical protein
MADVSDITAYFANVAANACYPNGFEKPSVAGMDVLIFEGWPIPEVLDLDLTGRQLGNGGVVPRLRGPRANVSIFPLDSPGERIYQILDEVYTIVPPVYGLTASLTQAPIGGAFSLTLSGTPGATEFLTVEIDNFFISSRGGASVAAILSAVAADINNFKSLAPLVPAYNPSYVATVNGNTLIVGGAAYCTPRLGVQATLGKVTHRQRQSVMVSIWAPDHKSRSALAAAVDNVIKQNIKITLPDTSMALVCYNRTNVSDSHEPVACYRRDLVYHVDYATIFEFPGTVISSVTMQIAPLDPVNQNYLVASEAS